MLSQSNVSPRAWAQTPPLPASSQPSPTPGWGAGGDPRQSHRHAVYEPTHPQWRAGALPFQLPNRVQPVQPWDASAYQEMVPDDSFEPPAVTKAANYVAPETASVSLALSEPDDSTVTKKVTAGGSGSSTSGSLDEEQLEKDFLSRNPGGMLPFPQLSALLSETVPKATPQALAQAIRDCLPSADEDTEVDFVQFTEVLRRLRQQVQDTADDDAAAAAAEEIRIAEVATDNRTVCRLICYVSVILFATAGIVSGLAIMWLWMLSFSENEEYLMKDLLLTEDMLQIMLQQDYQTQREALALLFSTCIATLVEQMGWTMSNSLGRASLAYTVEFLDSVITEWWKVESQVGVQETALALTNWLAELVLTYGQPRAIEMLLNYSNRSFDVGYEMMVGQADGNGVAFLTPFRYVYECPASDCSGAPPQWLDPMRLALQNGTGVLVTVDYRNQPVLVGYSPVAGTPWGLMYKLDLAVVQARFIGDLTSILDSVNLDRTFENVILLGQNTAGGEKVILTAILDCDATCMADAQTALLAGSNGLARALTNYETGIQDNVDLHGNPVIEAYIGMAQLGLGLDIQVNKKVFGQTIINKLAVLLDGINANMSGSEKVELMQSSVVNGVQVITNVTQYKFADQCPNHVCNVSSYIRTAAAGCQSGSTSGPDYRGVQVVAGYTCVAALDIYIAYSIDQSAVNEDGLAQAVASFDDLNANENTSSFELEIGQANGNLQARAVTSNLDFTMLTKHKYALDCPDGGCNTAAGDMLSALQGHEGLLYVTDYRNVPVLAATGYLHSLNIGLVSKVDVAELLAPIVQTAIMLISVTVGGIVLCTAGLAIYTRIMMRSMMQAEREAKQVIVKERQRFSVFVDAMYPKFVLNRVLTKDQHIAQIVPNTAVFFSDIYNFTLASNRISSDELLQLMGYTYGVVDTCADWFKVTKVKTIGDAYLAIAGLPDCGSLNPCLDAIKFAAACAQVFSYKFDHPSSGQILGVLQTITKRKARAKVSGSVTGAGGSDRKTGAAATRAPAVLTMHTETQSRSTATRSEMEVQSCSSSRTPQTLDGQGNHDPTKVRCVMSYGIAAGPVTAGVLQGKSPMFDIWGKTVNLASRMQTTGLPGRIQVSESVYKALTEIPGQQYVFEESHTTLCKGFGLVKSYYVQRTSEAPPPELMASLGLEPNLGPYLFENPVAGRKGHAAPLPPGRAPAVPPVPRAAPIP